VSLAKTMRATATARVEAVAPERGERLVQFLRAYRGAVQEIVNELWCLKKTPSKATLHEIYYDRLRGRGFRAHHVSEIYKRAREVVRATRSNAGSKPLLKKLTARIHPLDYKIDLKAKALRIAVLNDEWVELKLKWYDYLITIYPLPYRGLRRALHLKKLAERLQKEHPKSWRFQKWVKKTRAKWLRRAENVLMDSAHYLAKRLVKIAEEYEACIAFEDLKKVKENGNCDGELAWEVQLWCYRRVQEFAKYKALVKGLKTIPVSPKNTSRKSPNSRPLKFIDYKVVELGGVVTSRDAIASWNIALRGLKKLRRELRKEERRERRMRGFWVTWSPDSLACEGMRSRPNARNPEAIELSTTV
jgi:putative transposase